MKCPICDSRKAKRFCPAKLTEICPSCCGTLREVEIDCPSSCGYLQSGREYESEKLARTSPPPPRTERLWSERFLQQSQGVMMGLSTVITQSRRIQPQIVDGDVIAALDALIQTFETLDKGIYYDSAPASSSQKSLYLDLKLFLERPAENQIIDQSRLTTSQILDCLRFLKELAGMIISPRPKSRAFLDHLEGVSQDSMKGSVQEPRLILPAEI